MISKPYFSLLSILMEFGLVQFLVLMAVFAVALGRNLKMMYSPVGKIARTGMLANVGLVFFLSCCLVENYAEFPQAVFVPFLLFKVGFSRARQKYADSAIDEAPNA